MSLFILQTVQKFEEVAGDALTESTMHSVYHIDIFG